MKELSDLLTLTNPPVIKVRHVNSVARSHEKHMRKQNMSPRSPDKKSKKLFKIRPISTFKGPISINMNSNVTHTDNLLNSEIKIDKIKTVRNEDPSEYYDKSKSNIDAKIPVKENLLTKIIQKISQNFNEIRDRLTYYKNLNNEMKEQLQSFNRSTEEIL